MTGTGPWRGRGATLEAIVWLVCARLLIAWVPFGRWRPWLGKPVAPGPGDPLLRLDGNLSRRRLARAVARAARRLPGESRCLPRAMALQWMLRRRRLGGELHIGVLPGNDRGSLGDLHAWVTRLGEVLIGADEKPHRALFAAANPGDRA
jgi:hypothetical protein